MTSAPDLKKDRATISGMFNSIASKYDLLNRVLSFGTDVVWRKILIKKVVKSSPESILDLACGTGDLTISFAKKGYRVSGADIAEKMIDVAKRKWRQNWGKGPDYYIASAENLPFEDDSFDVVTISFGIRNFDHREQCEREIARILKRSGMLVVLEFATPRNYLWGKIYRFYFHNILPVLGRLVSKDSSAYSYLPASVDSFPQYEEFCKELENNGFNNATYKPLSGGISVLYIAKKT